MKLKLKSLGLPCKTGELKRMVRDQNTKKDALETVGHGIAELYFQETNGVIETTGLIGVKYMAYIPTRVIDMSFKLNDQIKIQDQVYSIVSSQTMSDSPDIESHFVLELKRINA